MRRSPTTTLGLINLMRDLFMLHALLDMNLFFPDFHLVDRGTQIPMPDDVTFYHLAAGGFTLDSTGGWTWHWLYLFPGEPWLLRTKCTPWRCQPAFAGRRKSTRGGGCGIPKLVRGGSTMDIQHQRAIPRVNIQHSGTWRPSTQLTIGVTTNTDPTWSTFGSHNLCLHRDPNIALF